MTKATDTQWSMPPNQAKALMLAFYESGDETAMNRFVRSCIDERVVRIMKE